MSEIPDSPPRPEVTVLGDGRYLVGRDTGRRLAYAVTRGDDTWVFLDGQVHVVPDRSPHPVARSGRSVDEAVLSAPMPATVALVNVAPGQDVEMGQTLLVLEAMKMELPITAPRDARVASVACRVGELVAPGVPLVTLEERRPQE